ncbi:Mo-dependent nitrogenase C-terminal domain-containing protein [Moorena sp. SIO3H5]|uniref:Mo-dependent nitrogenase C-terminal domain-containing protein n=1 Tax=Moorena sp. SIO3H5 TaxID=2607834 RepID=UPI0013BCC760|nr:Mo-dependent nitrogenase C-terminal domain-containing protein [Moorena sp. SIO3H5]NEO71487.1 nitrogenase [Moorena sp. SIO3H5]
MFRTNKQSTNSSLSEVADLNSSLTPPKALPKKRVDLLKPVRQWLDQIEITDQSLARFLSKIIPGQCPFERDLKLFGHLVLHIPPLCKLNPLYDQLASLRFRALCYLVDHCGEDIQFYA